MSSKQRFENAGEPQAASPLSSIGRILSNITNTIQEIIRSEIQLAKSEMNWEIVKTRKATLLFGVAGIFLFFGLGFTLLAGIRGLGLFVSPWLAALIVGIGCAVIGGAAFVIARRHAKSITFKPEQTIQSVRENVQWFRNKVR